MMMMSQVAGLLPPYVIRGEVPAQRAEGPWASVQKLMTPPSAYDADTSPRTAWGGKNVARRQARIRVSSC
jgi:hypothetical protein